MRGDRTTALKTVAAAALVVLANGVLVRALCAAFDPFAPYPGHTSDYGVARTRAIREAIPHIIDGQERDVIVLGSSGPARAFVPAAFDAALGPSDERHLAFNLAQLLLQPETALAMAKFIRRSYAEHDKRVWITIFGISVPEMTRDALRAARARMPDQAFAFSTPDALAARARVDPLGALDDGVTLVVFGNVRPARVGSWLEDWFASSRPPCESGLKQPPEGEQAQAALDAYCVELRRQFPRGVPPWNPATRGGFDFGLPATRAPLSRLVDLQPPPPPPAPRAHGSAEKAPEDIDEEAIRTMIAAVLELGAVSDHVFVLRDIMNPEMLAPVSEARLTQWSAVAERIAREGNAHLLDFNDGTLVPADFGDRTHLHPLAAERFSATLAMRVKALVQEDRAPR